jgi:hypothetical protein
MNKELIKECINTNEFDRTPMEQLVNDLYVALHTVMRQLDDQQAMDDDSHWQLFPFVGNI